jgi:hypothetical protein
MIFIDIGVDKGHILRLLLIPYTVPSEYPSRYKYNFDQVSQLDKLSSIQILVDFLSKTGKIDSSVILMELKRSVMINNEYGRVLETINNRLAPTEVKKFSKSLPWLGKILKNMKRFKFFKFLRKKHGADIMVDDWSDGVVEGFYGARFLHDLKERYNVAVHPFHISISMFFFDLVLFLPALVHVQVLLKKVQKETGFHLNQFVRSFFLQVLSGKYIRATRKPKLVISGNDNGFPVIMGKAAGAQVMLIQNAKKGVFSDASFKYADYFIGMGDLTRTNVLKETGCLFQNYYPLGSIRLNNSLSDYNNENGDHEYDILWISDLELTEDSEAVFGQYYSMKHEIEAIRLLNRFAKDSDLRIAYKCRREGEMDQLKEMELLEKNITYIGRKEKNTYHCVMRAGLVLSTLSSVVVEALILGKKAGYVNCSGNRVLNSDVSEYKIEYFPGESEDFASFVTKIQGTTISEGGFVRKNGDYFGELDGIIRGIMSPDA